MANEKRLIYVDSIKHEQGNILFMGRNAGKMKTMLNSVVTEMIANCPTVDAVEVVRCKDCRRSAVYTSGKLYCKHQDGLTDPKPDDFCSYGERREGE